VSAEKIPEAKDNPGTLSENDLRSVRRMMDDSRAQVTRALARNNTWEKQMDNGAQRMEVVHGLEQLSPLIASLTHQEYRVFSGMLHVARKGESKTRLLTQFQTLRNDRDTSILFNDLLQQCERLYGNWRKTKSQGFRAEQYFDRPLFGMESAQHAGDEEAFARELLAFTRFCYPGGVNIVNPDENPQWISGIPAQEHFTILNEYLKKGTEGFIFVNPIDEDSVRIEYREVTKNKEGKIKKHERTHVLRRGTSAVIGRRLEISQLMGVAMRPPLLQKADCDTGESRAYSRAGLIMSFLPSGRIALLDRGSIAPYTITTSTHRIQYKPEVAFRKNRWELGQSQVFAEEKPKLKAKKKPNVDDTELL
jgi:hypothetical protein